MNSSNKPVLNLGAASALRLIEAISDSEHVTGFTHDFYRYPARFSPTLVRAAIDAFTQPGDLVLDPFVGGGTTLVEALAMGRHGLGTDISALAAFVSEVKTTLYSREELDSLRRWANRVVAQIDLKAPVNVRTSYAETGYLRNLNSAKTWRLRKAIGQALTSAEKLRTGRLRKFARCAILRTAQWSLDGRKVLPSVTEFRVRLRKSALEMADGSAELARAANTHHKAVIRCVHRAIAGIEREGIIETASPPKLVLTSPPYPGVHVLYHRWQVHGGKETPAPFWIANKLDGDGASYYTMGDRKSHALGKYFDELRRALVSIAAICDHETTLVQVVAFSEPEWQLPRYLSVADDAGFQEHFLFQATTAKSESRLWRPVPNRKWYASQKGQTSGSLEVVLFHKLKNQSD